MPSSHSLNAADSEAPSALWARVARETAQWAAAQGVLMRDVVLLVPFLQLLDPARRAFTALGGWQPRVETSATLAAALAPPGMAAPGELSGAPMLDALIMAQMLRAQGLSAAAEPGDSLAFAQLVQATVATAHDLHRAAAAQAPPARAAWWAMALQRLGHAGSGAGALEALLCRLALEWARAAPAPDTDALFSLQPAAWVSVQAGGADPLTSALLAAAEGPTLLIDTDAAPEAPFTPAAQRPPPRCLATEGLEAEALAAAAEVIEALNAGCAPVALIALDRVLTRRVRALLERQAISVLDETGWTLATTRAAARVMALLRAARPEATADQRLEWLKAGDSALGQSAALQRLEVLWRAKRRPDPTQARDRAAAALWADAQALLAALARPGRQSLGRWLEALAQVLQASGLAITLRADAAGQQVLFALRLWPDQPREPAWSEALAAESTDLAGFAQWVDRALEQADFLPRGAAGARVVVTPMARALLRPFGALVIAGADERHLGAVPPPAGLLPDAVAGALGLATAAIRQQREQLALAQLLRVPRVCFVHRQFEGAEPLAASPLIDAVALARLRAGTTPLIETLPAMPVRAVQGAPVHRPAPAAVGALPGALSASAVESLRACPYQFFARSVLGLRQSEELDEELEKRDFGNWLHAVLHRFHAGRGDPRLDSAALHAAADAVATETGLDAARLLPYRAGFDPLVPAYLAWLHARDAQGLRWADGEFSAERTAPGLEGVVLHGRIDRIDTGAGRTELIDYKTSGVQSLKDKVRDPFEDTQLAFYALLLQADQANGNTGSDAESAAQPGRELSAAYLALDGADSPVQIVHPEVTDSARALLAGLTVDLSRLRAGAGLGALGEGRTCEYCEARGLCRRDHWAAEEGPV